MSGPSSADTSALFFLVLIVLIMARRTYALAQGSRYSPVRVFGYGVFSMLLFALFAASTIYVAVGTWGVIGYALVVPYAGIVVVAALIAEPHVRRLVRFEERADGATYFRLPLIVPVLSLLLFVVRLAIEVELFGWSSLTTSSLPSHLAPGALEVLVAFDLLFGVSIGLLIGRGFAVRRAYRERTPAGGPGTPLRSA